MTVDRDGERFYVIVAGTYYTPAAGAFAEVEEVDCEDGPEVELTDDEERRAVALLEEAGEEAVRKHARTADSGYR